MRHPKSKLPMAQAVAFKDLVISAVIVRCERCRRVQPNMKSDGDATLVGCLVCNHPIGCYS